MRTEGLATQVACRVLGVSEAGFYAWRSRPPSARCIRHAWLTDVICHIHEQSRGTYGARRVTPNCGWVMESRSDTTQ